MSKYKPYPKYKDSGVEWLGQVPEEWNVKRVKHTSYVKGRVGWKGLTSSEYTDDGFAYLVTGTDFRSQYIDWDTCACVSKERYDDDPFIQLKNDDLLITKDGTIGKLSLVKDVNKPVCLNSGIFLIRPTSSYINRYMYWVLSSDMFYFFCKIHTHGSTILHLYQNVFEEFSFPCPSISEQEAISNFLDQEIAHSDSIIGKQEHLIDLLEEKRISIISHAVTRGLNPDAPMKDSGVEWLGQVPAHWLLTKLLYVTERIQTGPFGSQLHAEEYIFNGTPVINPAHICAGALIPEDNCSVSEEASERLSRHRLQPGEIVFARRGEMGRCAIVPPHAENWLCGTGCLRITLSTIKILPEFAVIWLSTRVVQKYLELESIGSTLANLNTEILGCIPCVLPPLEEQKDIIHFIEVETAKIDAIISKTRQAIALAQERRAAIISAAVTGKICVSRPQSAKKPLSKSLEYFQKVVLAAEITDQLHTERTFGRVKLQKILYLSEYHAQLPFQHSEYQRYAAGPHDPKAMYSIEGQMKKQKWFDSRLRESGYGKEYVPLERRETYKPYYERYFAEKHEVIQRIIDLLRTKDTQFCEVVATLYGVWNDFLLEGQQPDDAAMFQEAVTNWAPEKKKVPSGLWPKALYWMRENNLVPCGWGEPTIHRQEA